MSQLSISSITIERATKEDAAEILKLQKEGFMFEAKLYNDYSIPPLHQTIESVLEEMEAGVVLKAVLDNKIIGTVRANSDGKTCLIAKLVVNNAYQNQGLAQSLMKAIENEFPQVERFELFTGFRSEKNLYLYKKLGYSEFKREAIRENVTLVFMEKFKSRI
jgi:N-acetylglutamate synthase-like GNAT family acetyltransferase